MKPVVCLLAVAAAVYGQQKQPAKVETFDIRVSGPGEPGVATMARPAFPLPMMGADTVGFISAEMAGPLQPVKGAPYSAEITSESVQSLADGNRITHKNTQAVYRDTEGRTRREINVEIPNHPEENHKMIIIEDTVAGVHYVLNSKDKTARKMPMPKIDVVTTATGSGNATWVQRGTAATRVIGPDVVVGGAVGPQPTVMAFSRTTLDSPANSTTQDLGTQSMEGVSAKGTKTTYTIAAGEIGNERPIVTTTESWYTDELKMVVLSKRSDPRFGDSTTRTVGIRRADQPSYLFEVPADYKLVEMNGPRMIERKIEHKTPDDLL